jgi:acetyltransferase-like isoleucine patch superfamily enzyme
LTNLKAPTWDTTDSHGYMRGIGLLGRYLSDIFVYFVWVRGNKAEFLRRRGVRIGKDCEILTPATNFGTEPWLIELGNRVTISQNVVFLTHDGANRVFRDRLPNSAPWGNRFGSIQVLDNSFVGANSILMPDIVIGPNAIVGAGSLVNQSVPPDTVVAGVPIRHIFTLNEYIERYKEKWISIEATKRKDLRRELTQRFWGELR